MLLTDIRLRRLRDTQLPLQWRDAGLPRVGFPDHIQDAPVAVVVRVHAPAFRGLALVDLDAQRCRIEIAGNGRPLFTLAEPGFGASEVSPRAIGATSAAGRPAPPDGLSEVVAEGVPLIRRTGVEVVDLEEGIHSDRRDRYGHPGGARFTVTVTVHLTDWPGPSSPLHTDRIETLWMIVSDLARRGAARSYHQTPDAAVAGMNG